MDKLKYYYRLENDSYVFPKYSYIHLFVVIILALLVYIIYKYRKKIKRNEMMKKRIKLLLIFLLVFQQLNFLFFFIFIKKTFLLESLPFYTCRIAIYTSIFSLIFENKTFKAISVYLGIVGSIVSFISPDLEAYNFPHVLFSNYFLTHYLICIVSMYYIFVEDFDFSKKYLKNSLIFLNIYLTFVVIVNNVLNSNYAYLKKSPVLEDKISLLPSPIYILIVFLIYNLSVILTSEIGRRIKKEKEKKKIKKA